MSDSEIRLVYLTVLQALYMYHCLQQSLNAAAKKTCTLHLWQNEMKLCLIFVICM